MNEKNNPYWGRKWRVLVEGDRGDKILEVSSDFESEGLRVQFRAEQIVGVAAWWADITLWNLNSPTEQFLIREGAKVTLEAGYKDGPYGVIYRGNVFQPLFDRENVTDYKTTLHCRNGFGMTDVNFSSVTLQAGYDPRELIAEIARNAHQPIPLGDITEDLSPTRMPRGRTIFGNARTFIREICQNENAQFWIKDGKLDIAKLDGPGSYDKEALIIKPDYGLIDTPQQTEHGASFRCLLDPRLQVRSPYMVVKLDMAVIQQMRRQEGKYIPPLDRDAQYKIIKVIYTGDTRGNEWYADATGINLEGSVSALLGQRVN